MTSRETNEIKDYMSVTLMLENFYIFKHKKRQWKQKEVDNKMSSLIINYFHKTNKLFLNKNVHSCRS